MGRSREGIVPTPLQLVFSHTVFGEEMDRKLMMLVDRHHTGDG